MPWTLQAKDMCVNKKQIEDQLKASKSIAYFYNTFKRRGEKSQKKKIKRCDNESAHLAGTGQ